MLKSKIHNAVVTQTDLKYNGSITIDSTLMKKADIIENERVQIVNYNNGERFETYVIEGDKDSGMICLNGPAARLATPGNIIHILSYANVDGKELKEFKTRIIILNDENKIVSEKLYKFFYKY